MRYTRAHIAAIGYELGPEVITSEDIEDRLAPLYSRLHISPGQLEAWTGIRERRWWPEGFRVSRGARAAAIDALNRAGFDPGDIEVLIYAGVCRDHFEPATACHVAAGLGIHPRAYVYDISNACLGVLNGMIDISNRIELGQIRAGMVVSCETAREITELMIDKILADGGMDFFKYSIATLTGGSGAVGVLITDGSFGENRRRRILGGAVRTAPEHHDLCRWGMEPSGTGALQRPFMSTDSVAVLKNGVELGIATWRDFLSTMDWEPGTIDKVISHQVGSIHRETIMKSINMPVQKDFPTFPFLGNIGTVSLPITAAIAEERGFLQPGDTVAMLGIGSGLNCMMLGVNW